MDIESTANVAVVFLGGFKPEYLTIIEIGVCILLVLFFFKFYQLFGLAVCSALMLLTANIQILKVSYFPLMQHNFALGTVAFASIFLVTDIITEHYGKKAALRVASMTFFTQIAFVMLMVLTVSYNTVSEEVQQSMQKLFIPQVRILSASLLSYFITQILDIFCFSWLADLTKRRLIWLRVNVSNLISQLCDSIIFNILCWKFFAPEVIGTKEILIRYFLFGLAPRFIIGIITTPILYLTYLIK